jgi:filamentous hemagglutinin family protein
MNANRYRLVFDETRGMLVPVCENMPSHGKCVGGEAAAVCLSVLLGMFGLAGTFATGDAAAQTTQRVMPAALAAIARPAAGYVPPTSAFTGNGYGSYNATGSYGEVTQTALRAIFNWSNLNIGKGGHVHFAQPTGGSAVNRIGSADPTVIEGMLTATGQLYLINQNGILFGGGAQVNVGGLVASTLNISDEVFQKGWLSQQGKQAAFAFEGTAGQFQSSFVRVEAGAQLASGEGGGIYMFAPRVENAGKIETPGGQAMLAAGSKVYLAAPTNARMRGFLVEVDPFVGKDADGNDVNIGGSVAVDKVGEIIARRGNITLAGLAVNHAGRMTATTTVDANGSIFIKARDTAAEITVERKNTGTGIDEKVLETESTRGGDATLEAGSLIEIVNEKAATERLIADSRTLQRSLVDIAGKHIVLEGSSSGSAGARIAAKSGEINLVTAYNGPLPTALPPIEADQRIFLGAGSSIDASGLKNVAAPITRNIVEVELRGDELKDSPLLRDTLSGTKVRVDVRKGTKIADVSGYVDKIERTIDEKSTVGGTVVLRSDGDVVIRENASIDVSGGSIDYSKGNTASSYLNWAGGSDAIEAARTDRIYTGAYDVVRQEVGYSEGKNAGSIGIFGKQLALAGDLKGGVTPGINQRGAGTVPRAATLELNNKTLLSYDSTTGAPLWRYDGLAQAVRFVNGTVDLSSIVAASALPDDFRLDLSGNLLTAGGFASFILNTAGRVELPASVTLGVQAGGSISLKAASAAIDGSLLARGGSLSVATTAGGDLAVGGSARLDASGLWTNDATGGAAPTDAIVTDGGSVSLSSARNLDLAAGSVIDVSAGARLYRDSKSAVKTTTGNAGSIALASGGLNSENRSSATLQLGGELHAYATSDGSKTGKGGKLAVSASNVSIGGTATGAAGELHLDQGFFQRGGFKDFTINGNDGLSVADNTVVAAQPQSRVLARNALMQGSGAALAGFTSLQVLAPELRSAGSVRLSANSVRFGDLTVGNAALAPEDRKGVSVLSEAGGSIALVAGHRMMIDGTLQARGGSINLSLLAPQKTADGDPAYDPAGNLWLTSNARLLAGGTFKRDPKVMTRIAGEVLNGGKIVVDAASGYLVSEAGSLIDASGSSALLDRRGASGAYARTSVASAGGSIELAAREGMLLDGDLKAAAGGAGASGGSLAISLDRNDVNWALTGVDAVDAVLSSSNPAGKRRIRLAATHDAGTGALTRGQALAPLTYSGRVVLGADKVKAGGFANLALHAQDEVGVTGVFNLDLSRSLRIDAPNLSATAASRVTLSAGQVLLGNSLLARAPAEALGGTGELTLKGDLVDLLGSVATQGIGKLTLDSSGDLRLRGVVDGDKLRGKLATAGDLDVVAAQVYPATFTEYELAVEGNPAGKIKFSGVGEDPATLPMVLSAGGKLIVSAPEIEQGGVLKAPFGSIELRGDALSGSVTLKEGSLTSVSGAGLEVPFGQTGLSGREWIYALADGAAVDVALPPEKSVLLSANTVTTDSGATVDLSGGGDLKAWEFTAGRGGSKDVLDPLVSPNTFAIVPAIGNTYAPYDQQSSLDSTLKAGDRITLLTASGGLPAGEYTLLPARYALLAGAYTVTFKGVSLDGAGVAITQTDGSVLGSAVRTAAVAGGGSFVTASRIEQVEIAAGDIARSKSAYSETLASDFFKDAAGARLPGDAGRLAVKAGTALTLQATIAAAHASGHRGAEVDLAAKNISVVGAGESAVAGSVAIDLASINRIGADSLLLGGLRSHGAEGTTIEVVAETLDIKTGSSIDPLTAKASALTAPELIAVASDTLTVHAGSTVEGTAPASGGSADKLLLSGDGALLRLSGGAQSALARSDVSGSQGTLDVQAGSTVKGLAVTFDATKKTDFKGRLALAEAGALAIGAKRISVGTSSPGEGITFSNDDLAKLGDPKALRLTSYTTIDLYGAAQLGTASLSELTLQAAGIAGYDNAGKTATVRADSVRLTNSAGASFAPAGPTGSGTLAIEAGKVEFGAGSFATQGFGAVNATASEEIRVAGSGRDATGKLGGHEVKGGTLTLSAPRITAATGADQRLSAAGKVTTVGTALPAGKTFAVGGIGGKLEIAGSSIEHSGRIDLPAGELTLAANGAAASDGVALLAGSQINATGVAKTFADVIVAAAAGTVRLKSDNGGVSIADADVTAGKAKALIDVSGVSGGHAGTIAIAAVNGSLLMQGQLKGGAAPLPGGTAPTQGSFRADAKSLGDLHALNLALEASGFSESRILRQRDGSAVLGEAGKAKADQQTYTARNFSLSADNGGIDVYNKIDAAGPKGGRIELYANNGDLVLHDSATLKASATEVLSKQSGTDGQGGDVLLGTSGASAKVRVKDGARIEVGAAAGSVAQGGSVNFRAARSAADGVNVFFDSTDLARKLALAISGAAQVAVEGVKVYDKVGATNIATIGTGTSSGSKLGMSSIQTDSASDFSAARLAALEARLGFTDTADTDYRLRPGVEVRAVGDLTLANAWDLLAARYGDNAGVLTLRATGDLKMENNLSDGFLAAPSNATFQQNLLLGGDSWSYRLVAGAETTGANPLALLQGAALAANKGNVTIGKSSAAAYVRTGTGDIDIAAARDIALLHMDSAVYTAGIGDQSVEMSSYFTKTAFTGSTTRAEFGKNGGDLRLSAGSDIYSVSKATTAAETAASKEVGKWLASSGAVDSDGKSTSPVAWWTQLKNFSQGFGVLGGGDLLAVAGGNIANAAFVSPTNGRLYTADGATPDAADLVLMGGGDVKVRADGNIDSILLLAGTGAAQVDAGGAMDKKSTKAGYNRFLLGDTVLKVSSRGQMNVGAVASATNQPGHAAWTSAKPYASFFTYTDKTAVNFLSSASGVALMAGKVKNGGAEIDARYPGSVRATAFAGDLTTTGFTLAPAPDGQLELLASGAIVFSGKVAMSDSDASRVASPLLPFGNPVDAEKSAAFGKNRDPELLHRDDLQSNRIVAGADIVGLENGATALSSPKSVLIDAGGDIHNFTVEAENLRESDVSRMIAGGDISYSANTNSGVAGGFILGGPGRGEVIAGKSIDLSNNLGIVSRGNLSNPYLPAQGASLMVMAGSRAIDLDALKTFFSGTAFDAMPKQAFDAAVTSFMRQRSGNPTLDDAAAQVAFAALTTQEQAPALRQALFAVLAKAGEAGTVSGDRAGYAAGYAVLAAAFPGTPAEVPEIGASLPDTPYKGDINLFFSQIKTEMGGDIELFAPGGKINAGLANAGAGLEKKAYELGVMTLGGGDINAYSLDNFEVNQSRVFTLGGGDIMLWSSYGGLDAGNGKKTAAAAPPALPRWDPVQQAFVLDASNSISGSGIGVLLGKPGITEGDVGLFAPIGEVNAGDAGIRSLGKVIIGANSVVGGGNIQGSQVLGAPVAVSASAPSLSGVSSAVGDAARAADAQTQAGGQAQNRAQQASLINVEVLALGDESSDGEERKRR